MFGAREGVAVWRLGRGDGNAVAAGGARARSSDTSSKQKKKVPFRLTDLYLLTASFLK